MYIKVWVVQEETGGIPDEPHVFFTEKEAEGYYMGCVNENHQTKFKSWKSASRHALKQSVCGDDWYIRIWEL